jgi:hypothetical protein
MATNINRLQTQQQGLYASLRAAPRRETAQRVLLVATVIFGHLSFFPSLRVIGALGIRTVALVSSSIELEYNKDAADGIEKLRLYSKIAVVAVGIIGLVLSSSVILLAGLAADGCLHALDVARAIAKGDSKKAIVHLGLLLVNTFIMAAMITGAWGFMLGAVLLNVALLGFIIYKVHAELQTARNQNLGVDLSLYATMAFAMLISGTNSVLSPASSPQQYPLLPIGGNVVVTKEMN